MNLRRVISIMIALMFIISAVSAVKPARVRPLPGQTHCPVDLDKDGFYEDMNGDRHVTTLDVQLFFQWIEWILRYEPTRAFDYNRNGRVGFADVVGFYNVTVAPMR
jgi:PKD repeat protein